MIAKPIRIVAWIFALAAVAVALALAGRYGSGYAVLVVPPWRIELSIMLFVFLLLLAGVLSYVAVRVAVRAWALPQVRKQRAKDNDRARVVADLHAALRALFGGRFDDAEKLAQRALSAREGDTEIRHLAAALAAWAAHEGGNLPAALPYLDKIDTARAPEAERMRDASKAYMLLAEGRATEALPILKSLAAADPSNVGVLKMKVEAEIAARAWGDVLLTLGPLERTGLMPLHAADDIRLNAEVELMKSRPAQRDVLMDAWKALESGIRYDARLVDTLATRLIQLGLGDDAVAVLTDAINRRDPEAWSANLITRYAEARTESTLKQIEQAERWLSRQPRDPALLAALGKLCMRQALWGKAQSYLEASVALEPSLDAHMTLARLMEQVGKPNEAMRHIKRSAELAKPVSTP
jgi:HemY protein